MILKCKNAFKEVGKTNSCNYQLYQECIPEGTKQKHCALSKWIVDKGPEGKKNKSSDIQGLLAHAKKFVVSLLSLKNVSPMLCKIPFSTPTHTDYRIRLLPPPAMPSSAPFPPPTQWPFTKHRCCATTAEYSHIAPALSHQNFPLYSGMAPSYCSSSTPPSCEYCAAIYKVLWTESQKFSTTAAPFLLSYSRCTWHTSHALSPIVMNPFVLSSHSPTSYRICLTYTYIWHQKLGWFWFGF